MNKGFTIELVGAGIALLIILILSFTFIRLRRGKTHKAGRSGDTGNAGAVESVEATKPEYAVLAFFIQPEPLGNLPGTGLPEVLIRLAGRSMAHHIAAHSADPASESDSDGNTDTEANRLAFWSAIEAKLTGEIDASGARGQQRELSYLETMELSASPGGHAARISYENKKYTVLIGSAAPVALASAPFSPELKVFVEQNRHNDSTLVLVMDGIAYAAISLNKIA